MDFTILRDKLINSFLDSDRKAALQLIDDCLHKGIEANLILKNILDPVLIKIGILWGKGAVSLAQTFVGSKIAEEIYIKCLPQSDGIIYNKKGIVIMGNIEDDYHSLGKRIVCSFLKVSGWKVIDLGNGVSAEEFLSRALEENSSIIGISAMMQTTAMNIQKVRKLIDDNGYKNKIFLSVGGAVFNWRPELVSEVGGDCTASNAALVDQLFIDLMNRRLK